MQKVTYDVEVGNVGYLNTTIHEFHSVRIQKSVSYLTFNIRLFFFLLLTNASRLIMHRTTVHTLIYSATHYLIL